MHETKNNSDSEVETIEEVTILKEDLVNFKRLDHFLTAKLESLSRNQIQQLFELEKIISSDGSLLSLSKMPKNPITISVVIPAPKISEYAPENIPLHILYEDEYLLFLNKPAGMVVHPSLGHESKTLVNALLYHCKDLKGVGNVLRPGIVHRLDIGTTGVMVVAKDQKTHILLCDIFKYHKLDRLYVAIASNILIKQEGKIETPFGRHPKHRLKMTSTSGDKLAITHFKILESYKKMSLIECKLETGKTHQIRVHLSEVFNASILNDHLYGNIANQMAKCSLSVRAKLEPYPFPLLHAKFLGFVHPITEKYISFEIDPPAFFQEIVELLKLEI
jgi:23S rRNA pseudouridine1911/1915/1917 synthase